MKKLLALCLAVCLVFAFAGCGNTETPETNPEIEELAISGKIDGIDFGLGSDVATVKQHYKSLAESQEDHFESDDHDHSAEHAYYNLITKDGYSIIDISTARFYYVQGSEDKGIAAISTDGPTFGFTPGVTMKYEVEESVESSGKTLNATEDDLRFLAVRTGDTVILRYEYNNYQLNYFFYENVLIATVLVDTSIWTI